MEDGEGRRWPEKDKGVRRKSFEVGEGRRRLKKRRMLEKNGGGRRRTDETDEGRRNRRRDAIYHPTRARASFAPKMVQDRNVGKSKALFRATQSNTKELVSENTAYGHKHPTCEDGECLKMTAKALEGRRNPEEAREGRRPEKAREGWRRLGKAR